MGKRKLQQPRFEQGETVEMPGGYNGRKLFVVSGKPFWNGFTWMYSFIDCDLSCGEVYLCKTVQPTTEKAVQNG